MNGAIMRRTKFDVVNQSLPFVDHASKQLTWNAAPWPQICVLALVFRVGFVLRCNEAHTNLQTANEVCLLENPFERNRISIDSVQSIYSLLRSVRQRVFIRITSGAVAAAAAASSPNAKRIRVRASACVRVCVPNR